MFNQFFTPKPPFVLLYKPFVRFCGTSVEFYGSSAQAYRSSVEAYESSVEFYRSSVEAYESSAQAYEPSVGIPNSSGALFTFVFRVSKSNFFTNGRADEPARPLSYFNKVLKTHFLLLKLITYQDAHQAKHPQSPQSPLGLRYSHCQSPLAFVHTRNVPL